MSNLTDRYLQSVHGKPQPRIFEKADRDGLGIRVSRKGKVTWQIRYRLSSKPCRMDLGTYPDMTLDQARDTARELLKAIRQGIDPRTLDQQHQAVPLTLEELIRQWYDQHCQYAKKGHGEILRSFEIYVFPYLGHMPADSVSLLMWEQRLIDIRDTGGIGNRGARRITERVLTNAKQAYKWGAKRSLITRQPLQDYSARRDLNIQPNITRGDAIPDPELSILLQATERSRMARRTKLYIYLSLIFGCRPQELREALVREFDFDKLLWTIPFTRHKTGMRTKRPLIRPIVADCVPLIQECQKLSRSTTLLFTGEFDSGPLNDRATLSFSTNIKRAARRHMNTELKHFNMLYDLRKTARTNWSTLTEPHVAEMMMGHSLGDVWLTYDRYQYVPEMRLAYEAWFRKLVRLGLPV